MPPTTRAGTSTQWPGHRYSNDLTVQVEGVTYRGTKYEAALDNAAFYAWEQPVYCVADGVVYAAEDKYSDHLPWMKNPPPDINFVVLQHGGDRFSGYFHLRQGSLPVIGGAKLAAGDAVSAGDVLGKVGDSGGSSEPHLHFGMSQIDATGRAHLLPVRIEGLTTEDGKAVDVVPGSGMYAS